MSENIPTSSPKLSINDVIGNADAFPVLKTKWQFFNHAGVSPLPAASANAIRRYVDDAESNAYLSGWWFKELEDCRKVAAKLVNATPEEIALVKNTAEGISLVANGIDWKPGDRVVTTAIEYPTNIYPWMEVAKKVGIEIVMVPEETDADGRKTVPTEAILRAAEHPKTKLVALSHVEFASGQRHDVVTIGAFCRSRGILFSVDAIQSLGVVPVDVVAMNIDYLAAGGHKWMLSPLGTGLFYCRKALLDQTRPLSVGAMSVVDAQNFLKYDYTLRPDAARYESGGPPVAGLMGFKASIELLLSLGSEAIASRLKTITDKLCHGLSTKGYTVASPRVGHAWSGIVSFSSPTHDAEELTKRLKKDHDTEIAVRGGRMRISAHFYNTDEQIDRLLEAVPTH